MAKKKNTTQENAPEKIVQELTGDKAADLKSYLDFPNVAFGVELFKHYAPDNTDMVQFMAMHGEKQLSKLTVNIKVILR